MKNTVKPLKDLLDSVRDIDGFPIGTDEDILALSDPPYYTACPNPYVNDFIEEFGNPYNEKKDTYHRKPFVSDVTEGKGHPIYNAHTYHTKVPHKAIISYINHFCENQGFVLDPFCGTGMTGVACQQTGRRSILSDLSPIASLIAHNYNETSDVQKFIHDASEILEEVYGDCKWMYETKDPKTGKLGIINYTVWSDILQCTYCDNEYVFFQAAFDEQTGKVAQEYSCPHCRARISKKDSKRALIKVYDVDIDTEIEHTKQVPVLINYSIGKGKLVKIPDETDLKKIEQIQSENIPFWYPTEPIMGIGAKWGDSWRAGYHTGYTHSHHFYYKRALWILSSIYRKCNTYNLKIWFNSQLINVSKMNRFRPGVSFPYNPLTGTLYVSSMISEPNIFIAYKNKINKFANAYESISSGAMVGVSSAKKLQIKNDTIDYVFTDPPFGANLMYSELNFLWESWFKVKTNNTTEAIINKSQNKGLPEYHQLMRESFAECYRVLKPNRWITVVFHNSLSAVWNAIQDSLIKAGFVIAQVSVLDKKQKTYTQTTSSGAVKNDLVISAYKPIKSFNQKFLELAGEGLEDDFIKMHLGHLKAEPSVERTEQMLYSKLLAYYVQRSYTIKYNSSTFYKMLRDNFIEEDGYWFNEDQIENYHEYKGKMRLEEIDEIKDGQMVLFIQDEKSSIIWLNAFLNEPKDFHEIHPAYTKIANLSGDTVPDIKELLDKNFIFEDGKYRRPQTEEEKLSVTEKRERELQREFDALLLEAKGSKKKIKECRKQAIIYGFEQCYKKGIFKDILTLAARLNKKIIENDSELTEFIEVAEMKVEGF